VLSCAINFNEVRPSERAHRAFHSEFGILLCSEARPPERARLRFHSDS
jgi:hypothetical protein